MASSSESTASRSIARIALVCALISLIASIVLFVAGGRRTKIGYVRTTELIYGFAGMKEAHEAYEKKRQEWQSLLDSLNADYQTSLSAYTTEHAALSATAQTEREGLLRKQKENLDGQRMALETRIREEDQRMTQGVLNQVNSMTQQYGKEHGYDLILATTQSGNILYGDVGIDITKELLEVLNRNYNPTAVPADSNDGPPKK